MIRGAIFIHSDPGHANADNPQENEQKQEKTEMEIRQKKVISSLWIDIS